MCDCDDKIKKFEDRIDRLTDAVEQLTRTVGRHADALSLSKDPKTKDLASAIRGLSVIFSESCKATSSVP